MCPVPLTRKTVAGTSAIEMPVRWRAGDPAIRRAAEEALRKAAPEAGSVRLLHENSRRRILLIEPRRTSAFVLKIFRAPRGRHRAREAVKRWFGLSPAAREWRALTELGRRGVPVPRPLAVGWSAGGEAVLALERIEGTPLAAALRRASGAQRRRLLEALGSAVAAAHAAGWVHRDLHAGNVLAGAEGLWILDWQRARRTRSQRARIRDLGWLDYSLAPHASRSERLRVRLAALGLGPPLGERERAALREVGSASERRAREHGTSRIRHALRPGRAFAEVALAGGRGLRSRELPESELRAILSEHGRTLRGESPAVALRATVVKDDARARVTSITVGERHVVVKESPPRGLSRAFADRLRGSAGRRAWRGGHALRVRGLPAPRPLAFLDWHRAGLPCRSLIVMEAVEPGVTALDAPEAGIATHAEVLGVLARLAGRLHRAGIDHGDLKATHVLFARRAGSFAPVLIDLEGVRCLRSVSKRRCLRALAELNASLPDAFPALARRRALGFYLRAVPRLQRLGRQRVIEEVVRLSVARRHRWRGADCPLAARLDPRAPAAQRSGKGESDQARSTVSQR